MRMEMNLLSVMGLVVVIVVVVVDSGGKLLVRA